MRGPSAGADSERDHLACGDPGQAWARALSRPPTPRCGAVAETEWGGGGASDLPKEPQIGHHAKSEAKSLLAEDGSLRVRGGRMNPNRGGLVGSREAPRSGASAFACGNRLPAGAACLFGGDLTAGDRGVGVGIRWPAAARAVAGAWRGFDRRATTPLRRGSLTVDCAALAGFEAAAATSAGAAGVAGLEGEAGVAGLEGEAATESEAAVFGVAAEEHAGTPLSAPREPSASEPSSLSAALPQDSLPPSCRVLCVMLAPAKPPLSQLEA